MPESNFSKSFFDTESGLEDDLVREFDRILLRLFNYPAVSAYFNRAHLGKRFIELDFNKLPIQVIPQIKLILGAPDTEVYAYSVDGHPHHGFKFKTEYLRGVINKQNRFSTK